MDLQITPRKVRGRHALLCLSHQLRMDLLIVFHDSQPTSSILAERGRAATLTVKVNSNLRSAIPEGQCRTLNRRVQGTRLCRFESSG
jgi:hypothetical protein